LDGGVGSWFGGRRRTPLEDVGIRPDYRFSFANERTFLAWIRTALALVGGGVAVSQLLPEFDVPGGGRLLGLPLIALGAVIALTSLRRWEQSERAMRLGDPLTHSWLQRAVALGVGTAAVIAAVLVAVGADSG
jgi:putative membrane protein